MAYKYGGKIHDAAPVPADLVRDPSTPGVKPRPFDKSKCGTRAGYKQHARHDEDPCTPCEEANAAYMDAYNAARRVPKPRTLQPCGTNAAYARHLAHDEDPCAPCTEAHRVYQAGRRTDSAGRTRLTLAPLNEAACGTYRGYKAHTRRGQKACPPCSEARTAYYEAQKAAQQERRAA